MKNKYILGMFISLLIVNAGFIQAGKKIEVKLQNAREIGRDNLMFASIASICEDDEGNFYVLDRIEHKVFKFSQDGILKLSFGNQGQGPGDFQQPNRISLSREGQMIVADDLFYVSFLEPDGTFIKRIHFNSRIAVGYIGKNRFYAWIWRPEDQQQVMLDKENNVIKTFFAVAKDSFSVSAPDRSGRAVMFNYAPNEYAPSLLFAHSGKYSAIAISNSYDIPILDEQGETISKIQHNVKPSHFSKKEKDYFSRNINSIAKQKGWPKSVIQKINKKIPSEKNYFDRILISEQYVFVFRIKEDITQEKGAIPVDIFSLKGEFLGMAQMKDKPVYISDKHMYFVESDEEFNMFLVVMDYQITSPLLENNKS